MFARITGRHVAAIALLAAALAAAVHATARAAWQDDAPPADDSNPYAARAGLSPDQLLRHLERLRDRPESVRRRPGYLEAALDAADRLQASDAADELKASGLAVKLALLHDAACRGDADSERRLSAEVAAFDADAAAEALADELRFYRLEQRAMTADELEPADAQALLDELRTFFADRELSITHLRLASATVRIVNRLPDDEAAAQAYQELGKLFAGSSDRELARYGRKIEKGAKPASLVGKPMPLEGTLVDGGRLDWDSYRGKVVLVDFWATWCGPCRAELPNVQQAYNAYHARGFDVVAISLDTDRAALEKFLVDQQIPWANVFFDPADGGGNPLAEQYNIHAIPATFLVDAEGKVIAENVRGPELGQRLTQLLGPADGQPDQSKPAEPSDKADD